MHFPFFRRFIVFILLVIDLVEEGREDSVEAVQYYVHVEATKINNPLVNVLLVEALATVFKKELGEAVHRPLLCLPTFSMKSQSLVARMLSSLKANPITIVNAFNW